jgi:hypothetical protein
MTGRSHFELKPEALQPHIITRRASFRPLFVYVGFCVRGDEMKKVLQVIQELEKSAAEVQLELSRTLRALKRSQDVVLALQSELDLEHGEKLRNLRIVKRVDEGG